MKKSLILLLLFLNTAHLALAQKSYTATDVFKEQNIVWYGLDFTHCRFIGQPTIHGNFYKAPDYVVKNFFRDWNLIPLKEAEKYDIKGTFEKEYVYYDIDSVMERNKRYNPDSLIAFSNLVALPVSIIPQLVNSYTGVAKEGIGVVYIVESFNHFKDEASYYVVVFDIASKTILFQENVKGKASGGSVKTYWAGSLRDALEHTHKLYKKWKKGTIVK